MNDSNQINTEFTNNKDVVNRLEQQRIKNQQENQANLNSGMRDYQQFKNDMNHSNSSLHQNNNNPQNQQHNVENGQSLPINNRQSNNLANKQLPNNQNKNVSNNLRGISSKDDLKKQAGNKVASMAMQGLGVPKPLADKVASSKRFQQQMMKHKNPLLRMAANKLFGNDNKQKTESTLGNDENKFENTTVKIPEKVKKWLLIVGIPSFGVMIFVCLFMTASQTYVNIGGVGAADKVTEAELDKDDKWHEEGAGSTMIDAIEKVNLSGDVDAVLLKRENNEISLDQLNDLFGGAVKCENKNCSNTPEFKFYVKMYDIYNRYKKNYGIKLDLPLIMSTLSVGEAEIVDIFEKNLNDYDRSKVSTGREIVLNIDWEYDYKNIKGYTYLSTKDFSYDMQILAKAMVTKTTNGTCNGTSITLTDVEDSKFTIACPDGSAFTKIGESTYKIDKDKYKEFLKEYFENKFYIPDSEKSVGNGSNIDSSSTNSIVGTNQFTKYNLTDDELLQIASLCVKEQGSKIGVMAEASLMANRYELYGKKYNSLYDYVRNSKWWGNAASHMDSRSANGEILEAVRSVLVDGKRTLPGYVDEHDCIYCGSYGYDIIKIITGDKTITTSNPSELKNHSNYIQHQTVIYNKYKSVYTFYSFPTSSSDPFGYTNVKNREKIGDFHYDNNGNAVNVGTSTNISGDFNTWKQCAEPWTSYTIGSSNTTMCKAGCAVTSIAIQIARSGVTTTLDNLNPGTVVKALNFSNDLVHWDSTKNFAPNFEYKTEVVLSGLSKANVLSKLSPYLGNNYYIILNVGKHGRKSPHHYVAVDNINQETGDISIIDPGSNNNKNLYDVYFVTKAKIYQKVG